MYDLYFAFFYLILFTVVEKNRGSTQDDLNLEELEKALQDNAFSKSKAENRVDVWLFKRKSSETSTEDFQESSQDNESKSSSILRLRNSSLASELSPTFRSRKTPWWARYAENARER